MADPNPNLTNDLPFDSDSPFETPEEEINAARTAIAEQIFGFVLDERGPEIRHDDRDPENEEENQEAEEDGEPFRSPSLEQLQEYYHQPPPTPWPNQVEERYRIYRVYPIYLESSPEDKNFFRHAAIAYRRDADGVKGFVYGYEA
jgi:hypothetical protein